MTKQFETAAAAFDAGYEYAVVLSTGRGTERDGEIVGYYKTKEGADRAAAAGQYAVLRTEYMD